MIELAARESYHGREWLASLDKCIARDSDLDVDALMPDNWIGINHFDSRILHLPVLWKKYHDQLHVSRHGFAGGGFWVAKIREDMRLRLAVSCGEFHHGYAADGANSNWDRERVEEETEAWNEEVENDAYHDGEILGADHWAKFNLLSAWSDTEYYFRIEPNRIVKEPQPIFCKPRQEWHMGRFCGC
jgi:hypothetical protein